MCVCVWRVFFLYLAIKDGGIKLALVKLSLDRTIALLLVVVQGSLDMILRDRLQIVEAIG